MTRPQRLAASDQPPPGLQAQSCQRTPEHLACGPERWSSSTSPIIATTSRRPNSPSNAADVVGPSPTSRQSPFPLALIDVAAIVVGPGRLVAKEHFGDLQAAGLQPNDRLRAERRWAECPCDPSRGRPRARAARRAFDTRPGTSPKYCANTALGGTFGDRGQIALKSPAGRWGSSQR